MATIPTNEAALQFGEKPNFKPHYQPRALLEFGVMGGSLFSRLSDREDIDKELFRDINPQKYLRINFDPTINHFTVEGIKGNTNAFLPIAAKVQDPRGWLQWYCRFYYGRKSHYDDIRIEQWGNSIRTLYSFLANDAEDLTFRMDIRQALLEMGWDSTKDPDNQLSYTGPI